jgi:hypothetical protein
MFIGLRHEQMTDTFVIGDVDIQFRVYASVEGNHNECLINCMSPWLHI